MNKPSIIFTCNSEEYSTFQLLSKQKGLSNARLFSHILHHFPSGKHILEFNELKLGLPKKIRFSLLLSASDVKRLDSLCSLYGINRPLMFKLCLSWYYNKNAVH